MKRTQMRVSEASRGCRRTNNALFRHIFLFLTLLLTSTSTWAQTNVAENDTVDNDFVIASLVVADPGDVLYSTVGHVALRMQCPTHNLDYVFSYESEPIPNKVLTFLSGNLKMGMFAIPFEEYLTVYRDEHRGVKEYILNLPLDVKRNLWRVCDDHVAEGPYLPYDYAARGCAFSTRSIIEEGIAATGIDYLPLAIDYGTALDSLATHNRRDILYDNLAVSPWTRFFVMFICNGSSTDEVSPVDKIIMPKDLVSVFQQSIYNGTVIITEPPHEILPSGYVLKPHWCTPLLVSIVLLVLALIGLILCRRITEYVLLAVQTLFGVFACYLVFVSDLVCTEYSTLLIPFNVLPAVCWRWRRYWALPYAVILLGWIICCFVWPHTLTDTPYIVLSVAIMASYINMYLQSKKRK